jgi:hypothetical protein
VLTLAEQDEPLTVHPCPVPTQVRFDEQDALLPPFAPRHVQLYGPEPFTEVALPLEHRFDDGVDAVLDPLAAPQLAFTAVTQVPPEAT